MASEKRHSLSWVGAVLGTALVLLVGAGAFVLSRHHSPVRHHQHFLAKAAAKPAALEVVSVSPPNAATAVSSSSEISVTFSAPLVPNVTDPVLSPPISGTWHESTPSTLTFVPTGFLPPLATEHLSIQGGKDGPVSRRGGALQGVFRSSFTVTGMSVLRLQQLLAELDYLPLRFIPATTHPRFQAASTTQTASDPSTDASALVPLTPEPGQFAWRYHNLPSTLVALWQPGVDNSLVEGAVMAFESDHGIDFNDEINATFYSALLEAVASDDVDAAPYDYLEVSTNLPETLSVWQDGRVVYQSLANTGIPEAPTALGSYPVYARYVSTTMSGYNPDGSYYDDPGVPDVAYFNGGDAVHGFFRAAYGFPQSLGCVELPYSAASVVFNYDPIGTIVTVF